MRCVLLESKKMYYMNEKRERARLEVINERNWSSLAHYMDFWLIVGRGDACALSTTSIKRSAAGLARAGSVGRWSSPTESSGLMKGPTSGRDRKKVARTGPTEESSVLS